LFISSVIFFFAGHNLLERLREKGFCKPHFVYIILPQIIIFVADSPLGGDKRHSITVHFELLVQKLLSIFAENPSIFAPVHPSLIKRVTAFGPVEHGLDNERLINPKLLQAIMLNPLCREN